MLAAKSNITILCIDPVHSANVQISPKVHPSWPGLAWHIPLAVLWPLLCVAPIWGMSALTNSDTQTQHPHIPSSDMCSVLAAGVVGRKRNSLPTLLHIEFPFKCFTGLIHFKHQPGLDSPGGVDRWNLSRDRGPVCHVSCHHWSVTMSRVTVCHTHVIVLQY